MLKLKNWLLSLLVVAILALPVMAGNNAKTENENSANTTTTEGSPTGGSPSPSVGLAASAGDANVMALLGVLVMKGVLAPTEANAIREAAPTAQFEALVQMLSQKGLVSAQDLSVITAVPGTMALATQSAPGQQKPAEPPIIPAVMPLRVLPIDVPKQDGMIPDIRLGSGAKLKLYGFYKSTVATDTASSGGPTFGSQDWPLPLLLADTGPTSDPQIHIKARGFRIGAQTEWVPKGSDFTLTGRVEGDFEGDYTDVNNRNISGDAVPSSRFASHGCASTIRLATFPGLQSSARIGRCSAHPLSPACSKPLAWALAWAPSMSACRCSKPACNSIRVTSRFSLSSLS